MAITVESVFRRGPQLCEETLQPQSVRGSVLSLALYAICGSALYGFTMGLNHPHAPLWQASISALKVPLLFFLTLIITLPTLHFISLLFGSPLRLQQSLVVLMTGIAMTSILLGAFAPVSLLFLVSGSEYGFLLLMHVSIFAFCGAAGLHSVYWNYQYLHQRVAPAGTRDKSLAVLQVWMLLYMFVGTQTAYLLSPFINRDGDFVWFGTPKGNFYQYLWDVIREMIEKQGG